MMKDSILKKIAFFVLLNCPIAVSFADAAIDAKVASVKARMLKDFAPPKASQYLTATSRNSAGGAALPSASPAPIAPAPASEPATINQDSDKPSGSWYVQPGDTAPRQNQGSGSSGFDHSTLY